MYVWLSVASIYYTPHALRKEVNAGTE